MCLRACVDERFSHGRHSFLLGVSGNGHVREVFPVEKRVSLHVPCRYGLASMHTPVSLLFVRKRSIFLLGTAQGSEYGFGHNVDTALPDVRGNQAAQRMSGGTEKRETRPAFPYHGDSRGVADL